MIVSFTPNPALDLTLLVPQLEVGEVNRAAESYLDPGGKGINLSRVVHRLGGATVALSVLGGHVGKLAERALRKEGIAFEFVWLRAETRLNVIVQDQSTREGTRIWDTGPAVGPDGVARIRAMVKRRLQGATVFVSTGSLLPGLPEDFHHGMIEAARKQGVKTILDADGKWLMSALPAQPDLIKPNVREAESILGRKLPDEAAAIAGARELLDHGPTAVLLSMGGRGSILATADGTYKAIPPKIELRSTVGSGDSMVAGMALAMARGQPLVEGLRIGTAAGAATATSVGTQLASAEEIRELLDDVRIEELRIS